MHNRFEELQRRCKGRRRKILLKWSAAVAAVAVLAVGAVFYRQGGFLAEPAGITPAAAPSAVAPEPAADREAPAPVPSPRAVIPQKPALERSAPAPVAEKRAEAARKKTVPKRVEKRMEKKETSAAGVTKKGAPAGGVEENVKKSVQKRAETKKKPPKRPDAEKATRESFAKNNEEAIPAKEPVRPVIEVREVQDLDALIRQYEKYPRYVTALKIANLYYEKKDYENAALWARKANLIDRDDEEAWVLYAKSEYALGNRERAKRILRLYLDYRDSVKARALLLSWSGDEGEEGRKR